VIFRARNRFRELVEHRGFRKADLLTIAAIGLCLSLAGWGALSRTAQASHASSELAAPANPSSLEAVK